MSARASGRPAFFFGSRGSPLLAARATVAFPNPILRGRLPRMEALKKHASKFREQVAKQQKVRAPLRIRAVLLRTNHAGVAGTGMRAGIPKF